MSVMDAVRLRCGLAGAFSLSFFFDDRFFLSLPRGVSFCFGGSSASLETAGSEKEARFDVDGSASPVAAGLSIVAVATSTERARWTAEDSLARMFSFGPSFCG